MWITLVIGLTNVIQQDWSGGERLTCDMNSASCYNECPVLYNDFDNTFCLSDPNLHYKTTGAIGIRGYFYALTEHVIKGPGEAGGWDNDPDISDIDGDGDLDLVVSDESFDPDSEDSVWVFYNDGNGNFTQVNLGTVPSADELAETDIDGDGDLDVLVAGYAGMYGEDLVLFVQKSDGSWQKCVLCEDVKGDCSYSYIYREAEGVYAGDLDGDGDVDIVVSHYNSGSLYWFEHVPSGTPGSTGCTIEGKDIYFVKHSIYPNTQGDAGWNVWIEDMDGDGHADIVATLGSLVSIYWNPGDANFSHTDVLLEPEIRGLRSFYGLTVADLDDDGDPDIAVTRTYLNSVRLYRNDGGRNFTLAGTIDIPRPMGIAAGDIDGDGDTDLYVASYIDNTTTSDSTIYALVNEGDWLFVIHSTGVTRKSYFGTGSGDLDGDGRTDLLVRAGTKGERASNREGLYWYSVLLAYSDSSTLISNKVDVNGPSDLGSYEFDSVIVEGRHLDHVAVFIRYARNEDALNASEWNRIQDIATCSMDIDNTRLECAMPSGTFAEFVQYKVVLYSFTSSSRSIRNATPYVQQVRFVFDESTTPIALQEIMNTRWKSLMIFRPDGRLLMKTGDARNLPKLNTGIYIIRGTDEKGRSISRVIFVR